MTHKITRAIVPIRQYYKTLELYINSYRKHHHLLKIKKIDSNNEKQFMIDSPIMKINFDETGYYELYTLDINNNRSTKVNVYIHGDTPRDILDRITIHYNIKNHNLLKEITKIKNILDKNKETDLLRYTTDNDVKNAEDAIILIAGLQNYYNYHSRLMNADNYCWLNINNNLPYDINLSSSIRKIVLTNRSHDQRTISILSNHSNDKIVPLLMSDSLYEIKCYDYDNLFAGSYYLYNPNGKIKEKLWNTQTKQVEEYNMALEEDFYVPVSYIKELNKEDIITLKLRDKIKTSFCVLDCPKIKKEKDLLSITVSEFESISNVVTDLYIQFKIANADIYSNYSVKQKISTSVTSLNTKASLLYDEVYFVFLSDGNDKIVSDIAIIDFNSNNIHKLDGVKRKIDLDDYEKTLLELIPDSEEDFKKVLRSMLNIAINDENYNRNNFMFHIMDLIPTTKKDFIMKALNVASLSQIDQYTSTFNLYPTMKYRKYDKTFIFPPCDNNYIFSITGYDTLTNKTKTFYRLSRPNSAESFRTSHSLYVIRIIEIQSIKMVGYVIFDTRNDLKTICYNTEVEDF